MSYIDGFVVPAKAKRASEASVGSMLRRTRRAFTVRVMSPIAKRPPIQSARAPRILVPMSIATGSELEMTLSTNVGSAGRAMVCSTAARHLGSGGPP